jgi:hypothetical protein
VGRVCRCGPAPACPPLMGPCAAGPCGRPGPATIQPPAQVGLSSSLSLLLTGLSPAWDLGTQIFQNCLVHSTNLPVSHTMSSPMHYASLVQTGDTDEPGHTTGFHSGHLTALMPTSWSSRLIFTCMVSPLCSPSPGLTSTSGTVIPTVPLILVLFPNPHLG